ncbi:MAG: hypothetical protein RDU41_10040, partial [Clostridia bacterium]|nr:hypothetical protein [Clostridia bacterium]
YLFTLFFLFSTLFLLNRLSSSALLFVAGPFSASFRSSAKPPDSKASGQPPDQKSPTPGAGNEAKSDEAHNARRPN